MCDVPLTLWARDPVLGLMCWCGALSKGHMPIVPDPAWLHGPSCHPLAREGAGLPTVVCYFGGQAPSGGPSLSCSAPAETCGGAAVRCRPGTGCVLSGNLSDPGRALGCPDLPGSVPWAALYREELEALFLPYDLKRLEMYSRNMVDYHLIMDMIPAISRMYFLNQLGDLALSAAQSVGYLLLVRVLVKKLCLWSDLCAGCWVGCVYVILFGSVGSGLPVLQQGTRGL